MVQQNQEDREENHYRACIRAPAAQKNMWCVPSTATRPVESKLYVHLDDPAATSLPSPWHVTSRKAMGGHSPKSCAPLCWCVSLPFRPTNMLHQDSAFPDVTRNSSNKEQEPQYFSKPPSAPLLITSPGCAFCTSFLWVCVLSPNLAHLLLPSCSRSRKITWRKWKGKLQNLAVNSLSAMGHGNHYK